MIHSVWIHSLNFIQDMRGHQISRQRAGHAGSEWPHVISFQVSIKKKQKNVDVSLPLLEWTSQLRAMVWPSVLIIIVSFTSSLQKSRKRQSSGKRLGCLLSALFYFIFHGSSVSWLCSLPPKANLLSDVSVMCLRGDSQEWACLPARTHSFKRRMSATSTSFFFHFSSALSFVFARCKWTRHVRWNVSSIKKKMVGKA